MRPNGSLKLVGEVRDLQIVDCDGTHCGIADELEFQGKPGEILRVRAILVGPGEYGFRLPKWISSIIQKAFGNSSVTIPWSEVVDITGRITLKQRGDAYGLLKTEKRFAQIVGRIPFA
jgi:sporulation protein YlmC with PRC-barrel domain